MSAFSSLFSGTKVDKDVEQLLNKSAGPVSRPLRARTEITLSESEQTKAENPVQGHAIPEAPEKSRKKKQKDDDAHLEAQSNSRVLGEPRTKEAGDAGAEPAVPIEAESDIADSGVKKAATKAAKSIDLKEEELRKAERTVFVGNVSIKVITSKAIYKEFKKAFSNHGKVESVRFRSISFKEALPRKAAFIHKSFHEARDTVNAYIVFKEKEASLKCVGRLNGTVFAHNHIRVDHVAHPSPKDNKRTIFVGNLDFEEKEERLWRYFNEKVDDDVESVRIVRDSKTNFGKGFALVQFKDSLSVNKALLLNDEPMPNTDDAKKTRKLRITRAKSTAKPSILSPNHFDNQKKPKVGSAKALTDDQKTKIGRAKKLLGNADKNSAGGYVAEGIRASKGQKIAGVKGLKSAKGKVKKPRITKRSAQFKQDKKAFQKLR